ncbi:hypothetical protein A1Q2_04761 [Trichosporon asahii var. asahii CBS 8904]|uniref:Transmembrane protein n=2 Tax=Trichosporon asahii var. asahii TaxID=189963 RepID=K1VVN4_TRIAC|nr:hypothetical protein A1Q1_00770 [Trichosporon asahii var. asahii CBS 2479]EJT52865.1 hypothetical protein A1Q1_00770 [Trichosporon asahii var. asahii CBS 2479]EKD00888.1 hypothetical protein A1Q2_04761 [Trichosporon asahii var. asahii CBS 8904]
MATTPEPFICGNQLGDWVEAALQFYLYTTWVYSIIYMVGYFMNVKIFGAGRIFSSACPKGFSVQNTWAAGYSGDTSCISDVAWSIEKGPRLTYLLMSGCVAALAIVLVSRARDAGLAFRWPSSRRLGARSPPPADQDNKPQHMFLSTNDNNAFQVYQYMLFAFLQIIGLLWRVLTAPTLHDPYPSCPKGLWTHDFSAKNINCFSPFYLAFWVSFEVAQSLLVIVLAWLAGTLLRQDNYRRSVWSPPPPRPPVARPDISLDRL